MNIYVAEFIPKEGISLAYEQHYSSYIKALRAIVEEHKTRKQDRLMRSRRMDLIDMRVQYAAVHKVTLDTNEEETLFSKEFKY